MNSLVEANIISALNCGNNFAYIINDNDKFLTTEYKVLHSQAEGLFVKCMKLSFNGKIQLYYITEGLKSLVNCLPLLDSEQFITVMANLLDDIVTVKNNGFLSCQNIDIDFDHIYIEPITYKVSLVYLPIDQKIFYDISIFENEVKARLKKLVNNTPTLSSPKITQFISDLSDATISLDDLYAKIKGSSTANTKKVIKKIPDKDRTMKIIAKNSPVPFEIIITKNDFVLGRKQESVDGVISFSRMVGRMHCRIIRQGNDYAIIDLQSANGTYINGVRLQPNQPCPIKSGDTIKLANVEFEMVLD